MWGTTKLLGVAGQTAALFLCTTPFWGIWASGLVGPNTTRIGPHEFSIQPIFGSESNRQGQDVCRPGAGKGIFFKHPLVQVHHASVPFPSFLKTPKTVAIIGAPMIYGQPRPGTDFGPAQLREAGCVTGPPFPSSHPLVHAHHLPRARFRGASRPGAPASCCTTLWHALLHLLLHLPLATHWSHFPTSHPLVHAPPQLMFSEGSPCSNTASS